MKKYKEEGEGEEEGEEKIKTQMHSVLLLQKKEKSLITYKRNLCVSNYPLRFHYFQLFSFTINAATHGNVASHGNNSDYDHGKNDDDDEFLCGMVN